ncbi:hypothetical protein OBBRIDRAFT_837299 [Obba rivulosa]|uniref:Uncharacterized protein n=1 Tax=Obba rivulosa TaxID=1052685 RepID=A0A8E2DI07_9APHY|nr:hypothetical protein OBBRIDRAFT_837299 [Obba rivulosa]
MAKMEMMASGTEEAMARSRRNGVNIGLSRSVSRSAWGQGPAGLLVVACLHGLLSDFALARLDAPNTVLAVLAVAVLAVAMAIAPITGKLRKRFWLDITVSLGLGISAGYAFWYGVHLKKGEHRSSSTRPTSPLQKQEEFYLKLEREKQ